MSTCSRITALYVLLMTATLAASAQSSSASYEIPRQSIDGGGGRTSSASHTLHGTIGQPEAGAVASSASYSLRGAFHRAGPTPPGVDTLFRNGFEP